MDAHESRGSDDELVEALTTAQTEIRLLEATVECLKTGRAGAYANLKMVQEEAGKLREDVTKFRKDAQRLHTLRILMGFVQDGSDQTVKLYQDDATGSFIVEAGRSRFWGPTFEQAIDAVKETLNVKI